MQDKIFLFSSINRYTPIVEHFVKYYGELGFTDIVLAIHDDIIKSINRDNLQQYSKAKVHIEALYSGVHHAQRTVNILNALKSKYISKCNDVSASCDIDEFIEYPVKLHNLVTLLWEATEFNCVEGRFVDMVSATGELVEIQSETNLFTQYPIRTNITRDIAKACDKKIVLQKGWNPLIAGQHGLYQEKPMLEIASVFHFKWTSTIIEHLQQRLDTISDSGYKYSYEIEAIFNYWLANEKKMLPLIKKPD